MRSRALTLIAAAVAAVFAALLSTSALAQSALPLQTIEAVVVDRQGRAVDGLRKDDFVVHYHGRPAEVANFHVVKNGHEQAPHVALFIDDVHLRRKGKKRAVDALRSYLDRLDARTTAALMVWNGTLEERVAATTDRAALRRALDAVDREPALGQRRDEERRSMLRMIDHATETKTSASLAPRMAEYVSTHARAARQTVDALRRAVRAMPSAGGQRVLLYVSEGLSLQPAADVVDYWARAAEQSPKERPRLETGEDLLALARDVKNAGVSFSAIEAVEEGEARIASAARLLAEETGGRCVNSDEDVATFIDALAGAVGTYYRLDVRAPLARAARIDVRVRDRADVKVLASRRQASLQEEVVNAGIRARLYSRESVNPLETRVQFGAPWPEGARCRMPVQLAIPPGRLGAGSDAKSEFSVRAMVLDERQQRESKIQYFVRRVVAQTEVAVTETIHFGLLPSRYIVSLAIVDHVTGETSYIQSDIDTTVCGS